MFTRILKIFFLFILMPFLGCSTTDEKPEITPVILLENYGQVEGDDGITQLDVAVKLQEAVGEDVILKYSTDDASAFQDSDYSKIEGQLKIPSGEIEVFLVLEIVADDIKEGNEMFRILFDADPGVEFDKQKIEVSIIDDDIKLPYETSDYETPEAYNGWSLAWADEFSETNINTDWWTHEIGTGDNGWGNNEIQYYTDGTENSRIENGNLIIEARDDSWNGKKYTSARMITKDKKTFSFSRTDIRAKLPFGQGIWPALWMLGANIDSKGWPACGEIDIMELIGNHPDQSHSTVHFGIDYPNNHKYVGDSYYLSNEIFNDRFHVFSVVREFNQMWFYVDDILFFDFTSKDTQEQPYPFNDQFFYIFNVAIGGNWPGAPDITTQFPQRMEVDYIRVFTKD